MIVWTIKDIVFVSGVVLLTAIITIALIAEKVMFFLERKGIITGKWRGVK